MRNARVEPRDRGAFERPADRDPLLPQLQRNRHRQKRERGAGHQREPAEIALARRLDAQQLAQMQRGDRADQHRDDADHPIEAGDRHAVAARSGSTTRRRSSAAMYGSRLSLRARSEHQRIEREHGSRSRPACDQHVAAACARRSAGSTPRRMPPSSANRRRGVGPAVAGRQGQQHDEADDVRARRVSATAPAMRHHHHRAEVDLRDHDHHAAAIAATLGEARHHRIHAERKQRQHAERRDRRSRRDRPAASRRARPPGSRRPSPSRRNEWPAAARPAPPC